MAGRLPEALRRGDAASDLVDRVRDDPDRRSGPGHSERACLGPVDRGVALRDDAARIDARDGRDDRVRGSEGGCRGERVRGEISLDHALGSPVRHGAHAHAQRTQLVRGPSHVAGDVDVDEHGALRRRRDPLAAPRADGALGSASAEPAGGHVLQVAVELVEVVAATGCSDAPRPPTAAARRSNATAGAGARHESTRPGSGCRRSPGRGSSHHSRRHRGQNPRD